MHVYVIKRLCMLKDINVVRWNIFERCYISGDTLLCKYIIIGHKAYSMYFLITSLLNGNDKNSHFIRFSPLKQILITKRKEKTPSSEGNQDDVTFQAYIQSVFTVCEILIVEDFLAFSCSSAAKVSNYPNKLLMAPRQSNLHIFAVFQFPVSLQFLLWRQSEIRAN